MTTGSWRQVGDLPFAVNSFGRTGNAVLLDNGPALFAGGGDPNLSNLATAAVYDPSASAWTTTGSMTASRRAHSMTRLRDGSVLAAGGLTGPLRFPLPPTDTSDLYNQTARTWTATTGKLALARYDHSASLLPDGRVLVAGGTVVRSTSSNASTETCEIFDPRSGLWTPAEPMTDARSGHCAVTLADDRILVVCGLRYTTFDSGVATAFCELYDPRTGRWTPTGSLDTPRHSHQAVLLSDGTVLAIGGGVPQLGGEAVIDPHSVAAVERFDPATQQWTPAASLPFPRSQHHAVVLDDGQVLVVGGNDQAIGDTGYPGVVRYDPVSDTWTPAAPMQTPRYDFSIVKLGDGRVLVVGGVTETPWAISDDTGFRITASTEVYTP